MDQCEQNHQTKSAKPWGIRWTSSGFISPIQVKRDPTADTIEDVCIDRQSAQRHDLVLNKLDAAWILGYINSFTEHYIYYSYMGICYSFMSNTNDVCLFYQLSVGVISRTYTLCCIHHPQTEHSQQEQRSHCTQYRKCNITVNNMLNNR